MAHKNWTKNSTENVQKTLCLVSIVSQVPPATKELVRRNIPELLIQRVSFQSQVWW